MIKLAFTLKNHRKTIRFIPQKTKSYLTVDWTRAKNSRCRRTETSQNCTENQKFRSLAFNTHKPTETFTKEEAIDDFSLQTRNHFLSSFCMYCFYNVSNTNTSSIRQRAKIFNPQFV